MRKSLSFLLVITLLLGLSLSSGSVVAQASEVTWKTSTSGTAISSPSVEIVGDLAIATVTVQFSAKGSYIQLDKKLTDLIGSNGEDGRGYIQIVPGDGSTQAMADTYVLMQLVGSSNADTSIAGAPNAGAMTWYPRGNSVAAGYSSVFLNQGGSSSIPSMVYGNHSDICPEGFKFAFTQGADEKVYIRSLNTGSKTAFQSYDTASTLASEYKLSDIAGDNGETGEDGVYFRFVSHSGTMTETQVFTVKVAYPAPVNPSPSPSETPSATPSETPSSTPSETPSATPSATPEGGRNPITGDSGIILAGLVLAICTGVLVYAKKRSSCR